MPDVRTNMRLMFEASDEFLAAIAQRIFALLPETVDARPPPGESKTSGSWRLMPAGEAMLNNRIRLYRYARDEVFLPHFDGAYPRSARQVSMLTFLIYLGGGLEGGETTFYPEGRTSFASEPGEVEPIKVAPAAGRALFFEHGPCYASPFHEGTPHTTDGVYKYVFRSDVMYEWEATHSEADNEN
ncbi:2OG-Fe(II) oxygenase family Oxidoreductase [Thecamonas trahens ATCC 50062]|uniref:2OG-Fe(II) oxygenase family Oxidoreductase n=1 Tax=Thecamonas trahens ATCC 50062 TaxID=461836 RepID=A0A0L0DJ82_THETB|nr:2OG-Fe(II) oxygenase family Oxidoreductase [Thecamonas trahens ATCC 50062]KNC51388.1 2OG-Fe(II) oxygenase family Oxidoreductase [Thecamonas trahens ATCC 50062]|eukprot:XP_013756056.1 2OG-Fe(II) oxygenase family Oxidoreductase [Thecamonas trahens ATCC 50062]